MTQMGESRQRSRRLDPPFSLRIAGLMVAFMLLAIALVIGSRRAPDYECLRLDASSESYGDTTPYDSILYDLAGQQWLPRAPLQEAAMAYPSYGMSDSPAMSPNGSYVAYLQIGSSGSQVTARLAVRTTDV